MTKIFLNYYHFFQYKLHLKFCNLFNTHSHVFGKVLMFHHITNQTVDDLPSCQCDSLIFESVLKKYLSLGYKFVDINEALRIIELKLKEKFIVITFDDIPDDMFLNGYPILQKYAIPFTVFIAINFIDKPGFISKEQLLRLSEDKLCTIGAHTLSHPKLRYSRDYKNEMMMSKKILEEWIGKPVDFFAYPYGRKEVVSKYNRAFAKEHFKCAFSSVGSPLNDYTIRDKWFLPRIVENEIPTIK